MMAPPQVGMPTAETFPPEVCRWKVSVYPPGSDTDIGWPEGEVAEVVS